MISKEKHTLVSIELFSYKQETKHCWLNTTLLSFCFENGWSKLKIWYTYIHTYLYIYIYIIKYTYLIHNILCIYIYIYSQWQKLPVVTCKLTASYLYPSKGCVLLAFFRTSQASQGDASVEAPCPQWRREGSWPSARHRNADWWVFMEYGVVHSFILMLHSFILNWGWIRFLYFLSIVSQNDGNCQL